MFNYLLFLSILLSCIPGLALADWNSAITELKKEKKIKNVLRQDTNLRIGVINDGSRRDGYAMYVCEVLRDHEIHGFVYIYIVDFQQVKSKSKWVKLGQVKCNL